MSERERVSERERERERGGQAQTVVAGEGGAELPVSSHFLSATQSQSVSSYFMQRHVSRQSDSTHFLPVSSHLLSATHSLALPVNHAITRTAWQARTVHTFVI